MKLSETPDDVRDSRVKYVENRWKQLSELDGKHGDTLVKYLMLTNSGGAAATLG